MKDDVYSIMIIKVLNSKNIRILIVNKNIKLALETKDKLLRVITSLVVVVRKLFLVKVYSVN